MDSKRVAFPAGEAGEFSFLQEVETGYAAGQTVGTVYYVMVHKGEMYLWELTAPESKIDSVKPSITWILQHFEFTN